MSLRIAVLPGDGIGPEVTREAVRVLRAVSDVNGYDFKFVELPFGGAAVRDFGKPLPDETLNTCLTSHAVLVGPVGGPEFDALPPHLRPEAGLLALRMAVGGTANIRPAVAHAALSDCSPLRPEVSRDVNMLIVREPVGALHFDGLGAHSDSVTATSHRPIDYSTPEIERVAHFAFQRARERRHKVSSIDKANVLGTSRTWRETVTRVGAHYPDVKLEHLNVDSVLRRFVASPRDFDVVLPENLFADIVCEQAAVVCGSTGILGSATLGSAVNLYEPVHSSDAGVTANGYANPLGAIACAALLLRYTAGLTQDASDLEAAIRSVLAAGYRTPDLARGKTKYVASTAEIGSLVEWAFAEMADRSRAYHAV